MTIPDIPTPTRVLLFPDDIDTLLIPQRGYDFNKGDRRFASRDEAVSHAMDLASSTGRRQTVRLDPGSPHFQVLYLVQEVGS